MRSSATKNDMCWFSVHLVTGQNTSEWMEEFVTMKDAYEYMASLMPAQYFVAVRGPGWRRGLTELKVNN